MWETLKLIDAKIGTRELLDEVAIIKEVNIQKYCWELLKLM